MVTEPQVVLEPNDMMLAVGRIGGHMLNVLPGIYA